MAKKFKKAAKVLAGLGAAYALSKMGKGTMDGTEGTFEEVVNVKKSMAPSGGMDGTEGVFKETATTDFNEPGYKKNSKKRCATIC